MDIVRVHAVYLNENNEADDRSVLELLCGRDRNGYILNQVWMGYTRNGDEHWPFVLELNADGLKFGEDHVEPCNIRKIAIKVGEIFTLDNAPGWEEPWHGRYRIEAVIDPLAEDLTTAN